MYNNTPQENTGSFFPYGFNQKLFIEKSEIRKIANFSGIALLFLPLISKCWVYVYYFIMKKIGYSSIEAYGFISEPILLQLLQILLSTVIFIVPFVVLAKSCSYRISDLISFKKVEKRDFFCLTLFGIGACAFANICTSVLATFFSSFGISYDRNMPEVPKGVSGFIITFIATAIIPAFVEEYAIRGVLLGILKKFGSGFALVTTSVLFGLLHSNFEQIPFAIIVGLALGYTVLKTNSIRIAMVIHAINNAVSVIFEYASISTTMQNVIYLIYITVALLCLIAGICLYSSKNNLALPKSELEAKESTKHKWFFSSAAIIIFIIVSLLEAASYIFI